LDHSVAFEKFGSRVDRKSVEKRLQLMPEPVAAERGNRVKFTHGGVLPFVWVTVGDLGSRATRLPKTDDVQQNALAG
jgi:hypothetical protein